MTKHISNLIKDIYSVVGSQDGWFNQEVAKGFSGELGQKLLEKYGRPDPVPRLRLSQMGGGCEKQLWHSIHTPSLREPFPPYVRIKFVYGEILESLVISMAKAAGHEVVGEQDAVEVDGVTGHRDCVIDGYVVDVKSAATRSFKAIQNKQMVDDPFLSAYLDQLDGYLVGSSSDPLVRYKDVGYIIAIDKTLGHLTTYEHRLRISFDGTPEIVKRVRRHKEIVGLHEPPSCTCETVADGKSGNIRLGTKASYSSFKRCCFPNLRTFLYSGKVVHLTHVAREPNVPELTAGNTLYEGTLGEMDAAR